MKSLTIALALATVVLLTAAPEAQACGVCSWRADNSPSFPAGTSPSYSSGSIVRRSSVFGEVIGYEQWNIVLLPGYMYGETSAMDKGIPGESSIAESDGKTALYNVIKLTDCCAPARTVTSTVTGSFTGCVHASGDATARASGVTQVLGRNTGLMATGSLAVSTSSDDSEGTVTITVPGLFGTSIEVEIPYSSAGESEDQDTATLAALPPTKNAPDEEYMITTKLRLSSAANGAPWSEAESNSRIYGHTLTIITAVKCGHCLAQAIDTETVDGSAYGVSADQ